jgi:single-strand DNA-binding protein
MADINQATLIGRLTRDAELKYTAGGVAVVKFAVAVNRKVKRGDEWTDEASFFDITIWGKQGEAINQYLVKGKQVGINGELRQERWQDNQGNNRSRIEIIASDIQLLGGGNNEVRGNSADGGGYSNGGNNNRYGSNNGGYGSRRSAPPPQANSDDGFTDDIPF